MSHHRRRRTVRRPGFTVVELLVALCVVAIAAALVVPRLGWARWEADAAARQIRYTMQTAQRLAVTQQSTIVVGIDAPNRRLRVLEDVNGNLQEDGGERVTWSQLAGDARFAAPPAPLPGEPTGLALVNVGPRDVDGLPSLVFRRDGSASASATLYLRARRHGDTQWRGLVVTQSTGRVAWWRASGAAAAWARATL